MQAYQVLEIEQIPSRSSYNNPAIRTDKPDSMRVLVVENVEKSGTHHEYTDGHIHEFPVGSTPLDHQRSFDNTDDDDEDYGQPMDFKGRGKAVKEGTLRESNQILVDPELDYAGGDHVNSEDE